MLPIPITVTRLHDALLAENRYCPQHVSREMTMNCSLRTVPIRELWLRGVLSGETCVTVVQQQHRIAPQPQQQHKQSFP